ncbi:L-carnitine dehydratase/bile acid-inducible protein F [uncultured Sporomusa sp.]|uniref:L-carnitine dehydratase/bile acid-inducible protein F n=1 Tax=uncultured Sporomusa sp. TaxID=307249 RepID=A0A212LWB7_9FIRM|nr:CoA transferase [uncultured Sporomusa sp.]SCM81914.1 L-carnitine dehydratase/bile acid-inducible protein F [uncultured Sporomusa sp.]
MLSGIKIIDFTRYFPGPFATLRLADWGAEVIKIEDPAGDPARIMDTIDGNEGCIFRCNSRGKKSKVFDLKNVQERTKVWELIRGADVVIESFRPGVPKRLGIDYETLKQINPSLVYCSLSGYGQNTSISPLAGHDLNYMAYSGVLDQLTDAADRPIKPNIALADLVGGIAASEAILAGLVQKARTGEGCYLDVSLTESVMALMGLHAAHHSATSEEHGINDHGIAYHIYETKDGRYVTIGAIEEKFWQNFCQAVNREDLLPGHRTKPEPNNPYYLEMATLFKNRTFGEWAEFAVKVDCCLAPVLKTSELASQKFVQERGFIEHKWGMNYVATHYMPGRSFLSGTSPYPKLGEDN